MQSLANHPPAGGWRGRLGAEPALRDLRRARRRRRLAESPWSDAAYRAYVTALVGLFVAHTAIGLVGDAPLGTRTAARVLGDGPAWAGLVVAVVVLVGARSGSRGGPLAVEAADVQHVLLSPHARSAALARPVTRVLASGLALGGVTGALVGVLLEQRLPAPGAAAAWWIAMATLGAAAGLSFVAVGLLTASRVVPGVAVRAGAWLLVAWASLDVAGAPTAAPTTILGQLGFWPVRESAPALVALGAVVTLALVVPWCIGGLSIEAARHRTALLGQLRFAVTRQDLRTAMLLRRQLSAERHRSRPWVRIRGGRVGDALPVAVRDLQSLARWPLGRAARLLGLAATWGLSTAGLWLGTSPLAIVAGLALFVAALDVVEPLAQELDHPGRLQAVPHDAGSLLAHHLVVPVVVMSAVVGIGAVVALAVTPDPELGVVLAISVVPVALAAVAGAAVSVVSEPTLDAASEALLPPEAAGPRLVLRVGWPPAVAVLGQLPLFTAERVSRAGLDPVPDATTAIVPVVVLSALIFAWVRYRSAIHGSLALAGGGRS